MRIAISRARPSGCSPPRLQAPAQSYGLPPGPKLGEIEVKAYQKIPQDQGRRPAHVRHPPVTRAAPRGDGAPLQARQRGRLLGRQRHAHGRELLRLHRQQPRRLQHRRAASPPTPRRAPIRAWTCPATRSGGATASARRPACRPCASRSRSTRQTAARCCGQRRVRAAPRPTRRRMPARRSSIASSTTPTRVRPATPAARCTASRRAQRGPLRQREASLRSMTAFPLKEIVSCRVWLRST